MDGWDVIKSLMAKAHCRSGECFKYDVKERRMVVAFMRDYYGDYSTIFISLEGSPPKAYAIIHCCEGFDPLKDEKIYPHVIRIFGPHLEHYKKIDVVGKDSAFHELNIRKLLSRKDVIIMNSEKVEFK